MSEKTKGEQLREELLMNPKNLTETMSEEELKAAYDFCEGYKTFLDAAKTEREAVTTAVAMLEKAGYVPFDHAKQYKAGDKVYLNNRGKALIAATLGRRSVAEGVRIGVAHIDSPVWTSSPGPCMRRASSASSRPTTTAASRSTSGPPSRWPCTAPSSARTAPACP